MTTSAHTAKPPRKKPTPALIVSLCLATLIVHTAHPMSPHIRQIIRCDATLDFLNPNGTIAASIVVEIAASPETHARGLMERRGLEDSMGMLFIYQTAAHQAFWMHNTPMALDMFFVDSDRRIFHIVKRAAPMSDRIYRSTRPAQYVVEVAAGFADRYGIQNGTAIQWKPYRPINTADPCEPGQPMSSD
jgi:uncharacterized membrane protein (UPF0127 family)